MLSHKFSKVAVAALFVASILATSLLTDTARAAGGIKAAYVETVIPSRTFYGRIAGLNSARSTGPGTGVLGVTSLTLTNFDSSAQQVFIFAPVLSGSTCDTAVIGDASPQLYVYVQPLSTLHLTFPSPLVFGPVNGLTCIATEVTTLLHGGSVEIDINGVLN